MQLYITDCNETQRLFSLYVSYHQFHTVYFSHLCFYSLLRHGSIAGIDFGIYVAYKLDYNRAIHYD